MGILLEEVLESPTTINRIKALPAPFNDYLENMRTCMAKAFFAKDEKERTIINKEVNAWRDKLVNAWMKMQDKLSEKDFDEINDLTTVMGVEYGKYMGR